MQLPKYYETSAPCMWVRRSRALILYPLKAPRASAGEFCGGRQNSALFKSFERILAV